MHVTIPLNTSIVWSLVLGNYLTILEGVVNAPDGSFSDNTYIFIVKIGKDIILDKKK